MRLENLAVKIFADGADIEAIMRLAANPLVKGFTTNPTLMRNAGISDYCGFAREVLSKISDRPVSFEVFADDLPTMETQALEIASWADNVNVKLPITNTGGESLVPLIGRLSEKGVVVNVTAVFTLDQVRAVAEVLAPETPAIVSVFAGRIADTGIDPVPVMAEAASILAGRPKAEVLWASPRELLNILHAEQAGCHIITVGHDLLGKLPLIGKDLSEYSLETVKMFFKDATAAGYTIPTNKGQVAA